MLGSALLIAFLAANSTSPPSASSCPSPLPNWSTATAAPERVPQHMNTLRLDDGRLLWNETEASEAQVRQYLGIISAMNPQPLMVLTYSAQTPCENIQQAKSLIAEVIQCKPGECLEVAPSST